MRFDLMNKPKKVALAYSGGLDTSVIIPWLKENYGCEVVAVCGDIGQGADELTGLEQKALQTGASEVYVEDLREEFVGEYLWRLVRSGGVYEHKYLLGTSIARPLLAKKQVEVALKTGCDGLAHGCTGKGNDQVRFELTYKALAPQLAVIAPWREWTIRSREDAIEYAHQRNVPISQTTTKIYSRDRNIWHLSHEGGILEDPWAQPDEDMFLLTVAPEKAPDEPAYVTVDWERGVPLALDGVALGPVELMTRLNDIGGAHGVGRVDLVENRLVGMKSRGVYETPGGAILYAAHQGLESICLDRETLHYKQLVGQRYAELVYYGLWFTPLREALDAFVAKTQDRMTGSVRVKLFKGSSAVVGRKSPFSLYLEAYATFGRDGVYDQKDAAGFINLFGLPLKVKALLDEQNGKTGWGALDHTQVQRD